MSSFWDRLVTMGFKSYAEYLASDKWLAFKKRYRTSGRSCRCDICHTTPIQLHHKTYDRLGEESLDDVTPLCREHHKAVHEALTVRRWLVEKTPMVIRLLSKKAAKPIVTKTETPKPSPILDADTAVLQCLDLLSKGITHQLVPAGWKPSANDESLHTFLKYLRRRQYRLANPKRPKGQWKKWRDSNRKTKTPQPDLNDEHTIHRLIAGGFRVRK